jgi:hypothetical protein
MSNAERVDVDALPYAQRLDIVLLNALRGRRLPQAIDLGRFTYNYSSGVYTERTGFQAMTAGQLQRLARRLHEQSHVTHLDLNGHEFGPDVMRELSGAIAMQTRLQTLDLGGT